MAWITGKWRWNGAIKTWDNRNVFVWFQGGSVSTSNGEKIISINFYHDGEGWQLEYDTGTKKITAGSGYHEDDYALPFEQYRVIDFGDGCEVDDDADGAIIRNWFLHNITRYMTIAEKMEQIADNVPKVFDAGEKQGYSDGYSEGLEAGKADERSYFWNTFMPDDLENWRYLFYSPRWNDVNFYPTKAIKPKGPASYSFFSHGITNFKQRLKECGVKLDTSGVTGGNYMFASCSVLTHLPTISFTGLTESISDVFNSDKTLVEIEKIKLKEDGSTTFSGWFINCHALETIAFEGVIGQNMDLHWSTKLSKDSITNIINHLFDEAEGKTLTLSKAAVDRAFAHSSLLSDGSSTIIPGTHPDNLYWQPLIAQKIGTADNPKWIINLIEGE